MAYCVSFLCDHHNPLPPTVPPLPLTVLIEGTGFNFNMELESLMSETLIDSDPQDSPSAYDAVLDNELHGLDGKLVNISNVPHE